MDLMLTHIDKEGLPTMVDVGDKALTQREATAESLVFLPKEVAVHIHEGDIQTKKGALLQTAIIAGTMAVKRTAELIPFCHPIPLDSIKFQTKMTLEADGSALLSLRCTVKNEARTGIEMEALTGASLAALTVYDMAKALSQDMVIRETRLLYKSGGKHLVDKR
jgi:cyclic pyranopterin phosphate synthase